MSMYTGYSDLFDTITINGYSEEELKNNVTIYVRKDGKKETLKIEKVTDLIPYYPYLIGSAHFDNKERKAVIYLSSESAVDSNERELLESMLKNILKEYEKCKRKNVELDIESIVSKLCWNYDTEEVVLKIIDRVKKLGKKATITDIHLSMYERRRQRLVDKMFECGLNPADYGYERFCKEVK